MFLDLSKAFDMVDPKILLNKLYLYGIRGTPLNWIRSFLVGRTQKVHLLNSNDNMDYFSQIKELKYGIGQGTKLCPILFHICINDMPASVLTPFCLPIVYADDSNYNITAKENVSLKQNTINTFSKAKSWLDNNEFVLNVNKTEILQFQNIRNKNEIIGSIDINDTTITLNKTVKFLGVFIDDELRFNDHVSHICKKLASVNFALGELRHESEINCLFSLYYANFHSILKYGIICWGNSIDTHRVFCTPKTGHLHCYSNEKQMDASHCSKH
jgi:hypothetical protein